MPRPRRRLEASWRSLAAARGGRRPVDGLASGHGHAERLDARSASRRCCRYFVMSGAMAVKRTMKPDRSVAAASTTIALGCPGLALDSISGLQIFPLLSGA